MEKLLLLKPLALFFLLFLSLILFSSIHASATTEKASRFWQITAVDTMKYSRDGARNRDVLTKIPFFMSEAAKLHVTHVTIDTPYDSAFYPILSSWVNGARKENLNVWYRGNFSSWEGWFGYPKNMTAAEHLAMTRQFILSHPDLFQNGDIFTPVPEPENGGPGDPRESDTKEEAFNNFLIDSYNTCVSAFAQIHKNVFCGFFSTNADIAKQILTPQTVQKIGNIVVIDNYVDNPKKMQSDLQFLEHKFPTAKIVVGEYGAPIPDINGPMNDMEQASFINSLLQVFYQNRDKILGLDYWTLAGASTELLKNNTTETPTFQTVASYYLPPQISGQITDTLGDPLSGALIKDTQGKLLAQTDTQGKFVIASPIDISVHITITLKGYKPTTKKIDVKKQDVHESSIQLLPDTSHILYQLRLFIKKYSPS
ncbi:MAG TPA: carboxypeptidase-like regulatory domain-containing protein [Candidatus Saccharimonadales bacterium]|nr:carboxypeptidase-like regulatory domain-containing protein [Candidatus Saccharimonadales bacterium]